ncbi:hypothetical protein GCM10009850_062360 [Nonomuraea monospora]|uniref:Uncharacterized protein n=1 Tax=Nonomuraea monospora TaxID=568818 RepID=A0ABN3CN68_9ACTN
MRVILTLLLVLLSLTAPARAEPPTGCGFQNLGTLPLTGITTAGTALDAGHPQGPRIYSVTSAASREALLGIRDARTGGLIAERPLPLALGSWAVTVSPDHSVYVGSYNGTAGAMGRLFRYDPFTDQVSELGMAVPGESFVWSVATSPDGSAVYGGTSPTGRLFRYDVAAGTFTDLGTPVPGDQLVRDLAVGADGTLYAGVGAVSMKVAVLAPGGGTVQRVIDPPIEGGGYAYDVHVSGRYLLVRYSTSTGTNPMGVYDLRAREWKDVVPDVDNLTVGGGRHGHDLYLFQNDELVKYDLRTEKITRLGFTGHGGGAARPLGWLGPVLVGTSSTGHIWHYDRRTGRGKLLKSTLTPLHVSVRAMGGGPRAAGRFLVSAARHSFSASARRNH